MSARCAHTGSSVRVVRARWSCTRSPKRAEFCWRPFCRRRRRAAGSASMPERAPLMPLGEARPLAYAKRRLGARLHSAATIKEAAQTQLCAYLSIALLLGLGANALAGWWWADPIAALVIAAVAVREGRASWRGEGCCDTC